RRDRELGVAALLQEERSGAHEVREAARDVEGGLGVLEAHLRELPERGGVLVEALEAAAQRGVRRRSEARAREAAPRRAEAPGAPARVREAQGGVDDVASFLEGHEPAQRRAGDVPVLGELLELRERAERFLVLVVVLEQIREHRARLVALAREREELREAQAD